MAQLTERMVNINGSRVAVAVSPAKRGARNQYGVLFCPDQRLEHQNIQRWVQGLHVSTEHNTA
jgi:hypothetical protein